MESKEISQRILNHIEKYDDGEGVYLGSMLAYRKFEAEIKRLVEIGTIYEVRPAYYRILE